MTTPTGQISFTDILTEFGLPSGKNLGAYRVSQTIGDRAWPLDTGVPTSGTIRFSDLRGKTCNVVVDYTGPDILSSASGNFYQYSAIEHVFNDTTNTDVSLTSSSARITISSESESDPGLATETISFTVSRNTVLDNSITFTSPAGLTQTFTKATNGTETQTKSIDPGNPYIVTSSANTLLRIGSGGTSVEIDDSQNLTPDGDYDDLVVTASEGNFYSIPRGDGTFEIRYVKQLSGTFDTTANKHYLVTFNDGTIVDNTVSNVEAFNLSSVTASDVARDKIIVTKTEKVSNNSFRLWFRLQTMTVYVAPPGVSSYYTSNNTFIRSFYLKWPSGVPAGGGITSAKDSYDQNGVVVGGFKNRPGSGQTKKVYHLIRRRIGNGFGTGAWDSSTVSLEFRIAGNGGIIGRGGNGGYGAGSGGYRTGSRPAEAYQTGESGYPALYASYPCSVILETSAARLQAGGGGGGGGGGACCDPDNNPQDPVTGGAGGGGGAGLPAGERGGGAGNAGAGYGNTDGSPGTLGAGGLGGNGGSTNGVQGPRNCAGGGGGGGGGGPTAGPAGTGFVERCGNTSLNGEAGQTNRGGNGSQGLACGGDGYRQGGPGGANGYRVSADPGIVVNVSNPGNGILFGQ